MKRVWIYLLAATVAPLACKKADDPTDKTEAAQRAAPNPTRSSRKPTPPQPKAQPPAATTPGATAKPVAKVTQKLESLGYQIDVPGTWKMRSINKKAYAFTVPSVKTAGKTTLSSLEVLKRRAAPASLKKLTKKCKGTVALKEKLKTGVMFYTCEQTVGAQTLKNFHHILPLKEGAIDCAGSGVDLTELIAACKTLRVL